MVTYDLPKSIVGKCSFATTEVYPYVYWNYIQKFVDKTRRGLFNKIREAKRNGKMGKQDDGTYLTNGIPDGMEAEYTMVQPGILNKNNPVYGIYELANGSKEYIAYFSFVHNSLIK